jgi:hypothetical protein
VAMVESERTCGRRRANRCGAARPVSSTGASGRLKNRPVKGPTAIFVCGAINTYGGQPWPGAEHTIALVAYVVVLGSPLTHSYLIVFIRSSE